jgi:hypothetical protein
MTQLLTTVTTGGNAARVVYSANRRKRLKMLLSAQRPQFPWQLDSLNTFQFPIFEAISDRAEMLRQVSAWPSPGRDYD